jgi:hypothetical protein
MGKGRRRGGRLKGGGERIVGEGGKAGEDGEKRSSVEQLIEMLATTSSSDYG